MTLDPPKQHENDNDDQDGAEDSNATMTVAADAATEATEQEYEENDDETSPSDMISLIPQHLGALKEPVEPPRFSLPASRNGHRCRYLIQDRGKQPLHLRASHKCRCVR
jgi:hypothetical protein